jgi:hypothetical protein
VKNGWLEIRVMCLNGSTLGLLVQYFIVALSKANYECWFNTKRKLLISHQNVAAMIELKN